MQRAWRKPSAWFRGLAVISVVVLAVGQGALTGSKPPKLPGQTLDDQKIVLPDAAIGRVTLLIVGVSKKGGERTGPWREHFATDFGSNPHATYFVAALLQSAPALFRGMIRAGIRSGTPVEKRGHVLTSASDEAAWKTYLHITEDNLPAVLLLDKSGHALWNYNGSFDAEHYQALKAAITNALSH